LIEAYGHALDKHTQCHVFIQLIIN